MVDEKTAEKITAAITEGKYKIVSKLIDPLLKEDPEDISLLLDYGFASTNLQNFSDAIKSYTKVIELIPESSSGYAGLGFTYRIQGENQKAIESFLEGIKKAEDNAMLHFELAETYFDLDQYENALKSYHKAIQFSGIENEVEILHRIAQVNLGMDEPDKAIEIAKNVLKKDPNYVSIYNILGVAAYMKENWKEAKEYFKKYLDKIPDDDAAQNILLEIEEKLK